MAGPSKSVLVEATRRLAAAGCIAPGQEAAELAAAAGGDADMLGTFVDRRATGEPLAWITGTAAFCGITICVDPGVYVPRRQSEPLAERAAVLLGPHGRAIDVGTGSGALARVLLDRHPDASVLGTETDLFAARCARRNGVDVAEGNLFTGVPAEWRGTVDVILAVLPYVPTDELAYLPRDVRTFEPLLALDGGSDGLDIVRRAVAESRSWLRDGGRVLLEVGGDQPDLLSPVLLSAHFADIHVKYDADGDPRGVEATAGP